MSESKTPKTDEFATPDRALGMGYYQALAFARTLELELNEANRGRLAWASTCGKICGEADELRSQLTTAQQEIECLKKLVTQHREGVARFLVPWRGSLDKSWLDHFVKECGVEFDAIGFVKATPLTDPLIPQKEKKV